MVQLFGVQAAIPALIISAAPFYARLVEIGLREVDKGVIEAARAMGAKNSTIILKVYYQQSYLRNNFRINCYSNCFSWVNSYGGCYRSWWIR